MDKRRLNLGFLTESILRIRIFGQGWIQYLDRNMPGIRAVPSVARYLFPCLRRQALDSDGVITNTFNH